MTVEFIANTASSILGMHSHTQEEVIYIHVFHRTPGRKFSIIHTVFMI